MPLHPLLCLGRGCSSDVKKPTVLLWCASAGAQTTETCTLTPREGRPQLELRCAPAALKGVLAMSGAFSAEFTGYRRYQRVYQPLLVHGLVADLKVQFGSALSAAQLQQLERATTYEQLHAALYAAGLRSGLWDEWRACTEPPVAGLARVRVPTLVVSALDDPLHHADMLGLEQAEAALGVSGHVAVWVTETGGHIGWPEDLRAGGGDFAFIRRVAQQFFDAL